MPTFWYVYLVNNWGHTKSATYPKYYDLLHTGCPTDWYPLLISIPDFSDGPIKKKLFMQF